MKHRNRTEKTDYIKFLPLMIAAMVFFLSGTVMAGADVSFRKADHIPKDEILLASQESSPDVKQMPVDLAAPSSKEKGTAPPKIRATPGSDKAPPELGFGVKTEEEIMAETPRAARIAALGPMSGELEFYGTEASNGAELASDELNAKGGIRGQEFDLLVYDTGGTIPGTQAGIMKLLEFKTLAIVGAATGDVSFSANKLLNENQLIMISAGSRRRLGDTGPYNFRTTLTDKDAIKGLVEYIKKKRKWKKFAIFSSVINDYSIKLSAFFKSEIVGRGLTVTDELFLWSPAMSNMREQDTSISGQLVKLKKNMPDAIVFTGSAKESAEFIMAMEKLGMNIPLVGAEDLIKPEFRALGKSATGALVYSGFNINSTRPKIRNFVKSYTAKFKTKPSRLAALSYDTYYILSAAITKAESMRPSHVRSALLAIKNFEGVTGKMGFDETGEAIKKPFLFEFRKQGDKYDFVNVQEPF
ncbi:hypothetical protein MNBD_NITROSPINAE02-1170 [hydrothermal vent metagenome]|uniref:Leucine-binding protein domain-containing protein n=1 Tax=hydrothermal vent metagenome TaxID=652676 RepID=A0A3B1C5P7_9ZZZZ